MEAKTLYSIKKELVKLYHVVVDVNEVWGSDSSPLTSVMILLQNMAFDGRKATNYDFEKDLDKFNKCWKALKSIAKYNNSHFENWIDSRIDCIVMGAEYMEDEENN